MFIDTLNSPLNLIYKGVQIISNSIVKLCESYFLSLLSMLILKDAIPHE